MLPSAVNVIAKTRHVYPLNVVVHVPIAVCHTLSVPSRLPVLNWVASRDKASEEILLECPVRTNKHSPDRNESRQAVSFWLPVAINFLLCENAMELIHLICPSTQWQTLPKCNSCRIYVLMKKDFFWILYFTDWIQCVQFEIGIFQLMLLSYTF